MSMDCRIVAARGGQLFETDGRHIDPLLSAGTSASGPRVTIRTQRPDGGQTTVVAP